MQDLSREAYYARFERMGEAAVQDAVITGEFQNRAMAFGRQWLLEQEAARLEERERRMEASNAESLRIARSAKNAAWAAAIAAIIAIVVAIAVPLVAR